MAERIYGPYLRKDGRKHVIRIQTDIDGREISRRTQSYPRFLLETSTGVSLSRELTVDHINRDKTDDKIENFRTLPLKHHLKDDALYRRSPTGICSSCEVEFELSRHQTSERAKSKPGPFCSKSCASKKQSRESKVTVRPDATYYRPEK